jgi:tryptophan-rich sensory protein
MMGINAAIILITIKNKDKAITLLIIPYFVWLIFAGYLNGMIWALNT